MAKKYHTLLTLELNGLWYPQFGDYDKDIVKDEKQDSYSDCKCKIITTLDGQQHIDAKINELNSKLKGE